MPRAEEQRHLSDDVNRWKLKFQISAWEVCKANSSGGAQHICRADLAAGQCWNRFWEGESERSPFQMDLWGGAVKEIPSKAFVSVSLCGNLTWQALETLPWGAQYLSLFSSHPFPSPVAASPSRSPSRRVRTGRAVPSILSSCLQPRVCVSVLFHWGEGSVVLECPLKCSWCSMGSVPHCYQVQFFSRLKLPLWLQSNATSPGPNLRISQLLLTA